MLQNLRLLAMLCGESFHFIFCLVVSTSVCSRSTNDIYKLTPREMLNRKCGRSFEFIPLHEKSTDRRV